LLAACNSSTPKTSAIGSAFAGPLSLNLRKDLGPKAPVVATLKHGDQVEVLERRRRFVRVRTQDGIEGWTDQNMLLSQKQMSGLTWMAEASKHFPSQGAATAYDTLNLHVEPNRLSPSFYQITEGMTVDVLSHRVTEHHELLPEPDPVPAKRAVAPRKKSAKDKGKDKDKDKTDTWEPLADIPAPPVPANLSALSRPKASDLAAAQRPTLPALRAQQAADDWSLVRLKDGKVGWVLGRMLNMSLPDDVVQYAEGHRITAYLSLGSITDKNGATKQHWLWTTQSVGLRPFDFDSFRVFVWSPQRHHYETALIERNVKGFYPIEAHAVSGEERKAFSIVLEEKDGMLYQRTYAFSGYHVRMISKVPYQKPAELPDFRDITFDPPAPEVTEAGWKDKVKNWWSRVRGKK
jgi:SH3-like domain-containing protein